MCILFYAYLETIENLLNEFFTKENDGQKADLSVQIIDKYGIFLLEQAKRAERNGQELYDMDMQLVSEQRLIKKLENHIKRQETIANIIRQRLKELSEERDDAIESYQRSLETIEELKR